MFKTFGNYLVNRRLFNIIVKSFENISEKTGKKRYTSKHGMSEIKSFIEPTVAANSRLVCEKTPQNLQIEVIDDIDGCKIWIPKLKSYVCSLQL